MFKHLPYLIPALFCLLVACNADRTPYGDNKAAGKYYRIRGMNMYCEVYGHGRPLLMIHGNGGSISTFKRNIGYFVENNYRVIVADSRSQGRSIDPCDSISFEQMADDYAALLDSLHIGRSYVFGWSDGGINALLLAIRHPDKVGRMAISGANLWPDTTAIMPNEWLTEQQEYLEQKSLKRITIAQRNRWKMLMLDMEQPHIKLSQLHQIENRVFVICGEHDMVRREHTQLIYNNLLNADMWVVPHADHYTISEHVDDFNERLDQFFEGM